MALSVVFGLCLVSLVTGQLVEVSPRSAVRRAGGEASFVCKVAHRIDACSVSFGGGSYRLQPRRFSGRDDVEYAGRGFEFGECGVRLSNIREEWSGDVTCWMPPEIGCIEPYATMQLVVDG